MDIFARVMMKDAAKCDTQYDMQSSGNQQNVECMLRFNLLGSHPGWRFAVFQSPGYSLPVKTDRVLGCYLVPLRELALESRRLSVVLTILRY